MIYFFAEHSRRGHKLQGICLENRLLLVVVKTGGRAGNEELASKGRQNEK